MDNYKVSRKKIPQIEYFPVLIKTEIKKTDIK